MTGVEICDMNRNTFLQVRRGRACPSLYVSGAAKTKTLPLSNVTDPGG